MTDNETNRTLNDEFRQSLQGGTLVLTSGVMALGAEAQQRIIELVGAFDDFTSEIDPYGQHDLGSAEICGERIYFKIDYFVDSRATHPDDPAELSVTERVITFMLASEI